MVTAEWEKINEYTYKCSNCGYFVIYGKWSEFLHNTLILPEYCENCGADMRRRRMTNREKLNNMSNEELAQFLGYITECEFCPTADTCTSGENGRCDDSFCKWLESEAENEEGRRNNSKLKV